LNDALDELRRVIPYAETGGGQQQQSSPQSNARKLSKINTIILATNWLGTSFFMLFFKETISGYAS